MIDKNKADDNAILAWLDPLIGPLSLDFVAPFPLEEACQLLAREQQTGLLRYRKVYVNLIPLDADTFEFTVRKTGSRYATTRARGYLKRWGRGTTRITGQVNAEPVQYLVFVPVVLVMLAMFVLWLRMPVFALVFMAIMLLNWTLMRRNRHDVARLIETALHADRADSDGNLITWNA